MASFTIDLKTASRLTKLFSYPNQPNSTESLSETILHWVNQMLARDGFLAKGATASVHVDKSQFKLTLEGPEAMAGYVDRLPKFLDHGADALDVIKTLKKEKKTWPSWVQPPLKDRLWDPWDRGNWRFFLPIGMALLEQKIVNFFHYPPMRLLDEMRDYLADPVPVRLIELMLANGIKTEEEAWLYSTVMDGAPIAAPDDEGTIYHPTSPRSTPPVHLLPIEHFHEYQKAQTELLLNDSKVDGFTIPIVVYGTSARKSFNRIWKTDLSRRNPADLVEVAEGKKTPVLCSGHPYAFFAKVQTEVGAGSMKPEAWELGVSTMKHDLAVIRWQNRLSANPKLNPSAEWKKCEAYWRDSAQLEKVFQLVLHQGSLWYRDPKSLDFEFQLSMDDVAERAADAAKDVRDAEAWKKKSSSRSSKTKKSGAKKASTKKASTKKASTKKASTKKASTKKASTKKKKSATKKTTSK